MLVASDEKTDRELKVVKIPLGRAAASSFDPDDQYDLARYFASRADAEKLGPSRIAKIMEGSLKKQAANPASPLQAEVSVRVLLSTATFSLAVHEAAFLQTLLAELSAVLFHAVTPSTKAKRVAAHSETTATATPALEASHLATLRRRFSSARALDGLNVSFTLLNRSAGM